MSAQTANNPASADAGAGMEILARRARRKARWFYWVAGLSVVNTIIALAGGKIQFVVGLGIPGSLVSVIWPFVVRSREALMSISSYFAEPRGVLLLARITIFLCTLLVAGAFVLFGYFASRVERWAFIAGMIVYSIDAAIVVRFSLYLGAAFHAFVLFELWQGALAANHYAKLHMGTAYAGVPSPAIGQLAYASGVGSVPQPAPMQPTTPSPDAPSALTPPRAAVYSCSSCGAAGEGMNFCGECGAEIRIARACSHCGASLSPGSKFCGECGTGAP